MVIKAPMRPSELYWNARAQLIIPTIQQLLRFFRAHGMPVFHTRNGSITPHGRESTKRLRDGGAGHMSGEESSVVATPRYRGAPAYELTPKLAAEEGELVVDKLTSSAFHHTMLGETSLSCF